MIKLNKKVEYALMALKYMAEKGQNDLTTAREVCHFFKTPFDTVAKVMQALNSQGILRSTKGVKGGYHLQKPLSQISLIDLVTLLEGRKYTPDCETDEGNCELIENCNIVHPISKLYELLNKTLGGLTLQELLIEGDNVQLLRNENEKRLTAV